MNTCNEVHYNWGISCGPNCQFMLHFWTEDCAIGEELLQKSTEAEFLETEERKLFWICFHWTFTSGFLFNYWFSYDGEVQIVFSSSSFYYAKTERLSTWLKSTRKMWFETPELSVGHLSLLRIFGTISPDKIPPKLFVERINNAWNL